jgi:rRNA maturation RNase YbeY
VKNIDFFSEDINYSIKDSNKISKWIYQIIRKEQKQLEHINIIFCSNEYLLKINKDYLNHNYYTDVITFPYHQTNKPIHGDVFISIPQVEHNAYQFFTTFEEELNRVIAHGVLHLIGYSDYSNYEKEVMEEKEDYYLSIF